MFEHLPEFVDPLVLVDKRRRFKGAFPLAKMPRLQDVLLTNAGEATFELNFTKEGRVAAVLGGIEAELELQCQCCLEPIRLHLSSEVRLGIVRSIAEADLLPESFEPLLLEEETMRLADIVQDELLLAIPLIPQHAQCKRSSAEARKSGGERENPFAALADFKKLSLQ
jgi:uncharacterized protein